jgi:hypothetical protein
MWCVDELLDQVKASCRMSPHIERAAPISNAKRIDPVRCTFIATAAGVLQKHKMLLQSEHSVSGTGLAKVIVEYWWRGRRLLRLAARGTTMHAAIIHQT